MNLCLSVSPSWKVRNNEGKYIIKRMFEEELPRDLLYAPKKGFCVPMQSWGPEVMSGYLRDRLPGFCEKTDVFDQSSLESALENGSQANMWNLYFLVNWYEKWFA